MGIISVIIGIGMAAYVVGLRQAVSRQVVQWNTLWQTRAEGKISGKRVEMQGVPAYDELLRRRGVLQGMVEMARGDSVGLLLDLPDSTARLVIKGLTVREVPIRCIELSSFFSCLSWEALYELLSGPFRTETFRSTIPKEPFNIVQAPKDSGYAIPAVQPDTTHSEPVFFLLDTDKEVRFCFYQTEGGWPDCWVNFVFGWTERYRKVKADLDSLLCGRMPAYRPVVRIGISKADAKVIFRALPVRADIVLTF